MPIEQLPKSTYAYCASAALCLNFATTRADIPTVSAEVAMKADGRQYDWSNKRTFQFTQAELAEFCAFLFFPKGQRRWIHRSPSGETKSFQVSIDGPNVLAELSAPGFCGRIPVIPRDQYLLRNFGLSRLVQGQPQLSNDHHLQSLQQLASSF